MIDWAESLLFFLQPETDRRKIAAAAARESVQYPRHFIRIILFRYS
jgi:hypothetical protein